MQAKPYLKSVTLLKPPDKLHKYPFNIPAFRDMETLEFHPDITFLIGENGSGKSTLLEAIAILMECGAQGGTGNFKLDDPSGLSELWCHLKPRRSYQRPKDRFFLRAESFYNISTFLEQLANDPDARTTPEKVFRRYGGISLHHRSHGEAFIALLTSGFGGKGLYILDEPEAALSPARQLAAMVRMHDLVKKQSQFIIATHSPIMMSYPGARIYLLDENGYREVSFEETEHYKVTRDFLNNYPKRLKTLLSDQPLLDLLEEDV
jgi:predicted ATPase